MSSLSTCPAARERPSAESRFPGWELRQPQREMPQAPYGGAQRSADAERGTPTAPPRSPGWYRQRSQWRWSLAAFLPGFLNQPGDAVDLFVGQPGALAAEQGGHCFFGRPIEERVHQMPERRLARRVASNRRHVD